MIKFINYIPSYVCGNIVTINDYYIESRKYLECELYNIIDSNDIIKHTNNMLDVMKLVSRYMYSGPSKIFNPNIINSSDTIITTFWCAYIGGLYKYLEKKHINKLILLDSLDFFTSYIEGNLFDIFKILSDASNSIYILANPFNINICSTKLGKLNNINLIPYYNKLSIDRLNKLSSISVSEKTLIRSEILSKFYKDYYIYNNNKVFIDTFSFNRFAYCRHYRINNNGKYIYIENVGKILIEYLCKNKAVDYYNFNKDIDDGMHYYLNYLGIDDNKCYTNLKVDASTLNSRVILNNNDFIYTILDK